MLISTLLVAAGFLTPPAAPGPGTPAAGPLAGPIAGVISLKAARTQGVGATVTVRGLVLNGAELGGLRFVQDGESGLALYALPSRVPGFDALHAGDSVQVTGQLKNYNGLLEMDPVLAVHKVTGNRPLRALRVPAAALTGAFVEANEGRLVEITGVTRLTSPAGATVTTLAANANYLLNGQSGGLLRVVNASTGPAGLVDAAVPQGEVFNVRGLLSQYSPTGTGGYQLLPRLAADLVRGGGLPLLTGEPVPVSVTPQSVTIEFTTTHPGDTRVKYGPSATQLLETRTSETLTTQHRIVLDGLAPGTTYYVQAGSHNAAGTTSAPAVPIITGGKKKK
ncbi:fibronectin type III domain-containing protein [Hymenobacter bucti]|uniref:Fibronectin type III domain-containing protein n=1 Tax=Hymenobacter bucti TaxID=1844114 RepID=A0ABW4QYP8_9BACT